MPLEPEVSLFAFAEADGFRGVIDSVPHPIFVKDDQTRFIVMNEMMCRLMNRSFEELVGRTDYDFVPKEQADVFRGNDLRVLLTGETNENEELFTDRDGTLRTIVTRKKRLVLEDGRRLLVGCITDVSDFKRAEALVEHNANHDALTGLPNRRLFAAQAREAIETARSTEAHYALLIVDLDRFKPINDSYGHTVGDSVLCEVAARLKDVAKGNFVARLGGDEFAIIIHKLEDENSARWASRAMAEAIASRLAAPIVIDDHSVAIGSSVGIALSVVDDATPEAILRRADVAMYEAKARGRNGIVVFEPGMDLEIRRRSRLERDLRAAVQGRDIRPFYQPLVRLPERTVAGFEILARWNHPEFGPISPETFIPIAERTGQIEELSLALLREACRDAASWPGAPTLSLNLSAGQLADELLPMKLLRVLQEESFPPARLELEITENALVADAYAAKAVLGSLQRLGMKVSLDDFGTGYSSMHHLRELNFDKIKIDRSFVMAMNEDRESRKIVDAMLSLTRSLGLITTAEGIENAAAMDEMIARGCEFGQGFLFGQAVPASEVQALLTAQSRKIA